MTLRCKNCGGSLKCIFAGGGDRSAFERYECEECGTKGSMSVDFETNTKKYHNIVVVQ